jgi:hypothetical protein
VRRWKLLGGRYHEALYQLRCVAAHLEAEVPAPLLLEKIGESSEVVVGAEQHDAGGDLVTARVLPEPQDPLKRALQLAGHASMKRARPSEAQYWVMMASRSWSKSPPDRRVTARTCLTCWGSGRLSSRCSIPVSTIVAPARLIGVGFHRAPAGVCAR